MAELRIGPPPTDRLLRLGRPAMARRLLRSWQIEVRHPENLPATGPVIVAANHMGWLDGLLLAIFAPRPVHALAKDDLFEGRMGRLLRASGQIPVSRTTTDYAAIRAGLSVLEAGRVLGIFPEGIRGDGSARNLRNGAAYFGLMTGAPIVPVAFLGTREPGGARESRPPRGTAMSLTFGAPLTIERAEWPRDVGLVAAATDRIGKAMRATLAAAMADTGMELPGPVAEETA